MAALGNNSGDLGFLEGRFKFGDKNDVRRGLMINLTYDV
jgi:hypothetical protein